MNSKLNENQIRGIDFAVRVSAKSFPFIEGWQFSNSFYKHYDEVYPIVYIDLIVNLEEVENTFDFKIYDYWIQYAKKQPLPDILYLSSLMQNPTGDFNEKKIIEADLNINYENLPNKYKGKQLVGLINKYGFIKTIAVQYYLTEPTQSEFYEIN